MIRFSYLFVYYLLILLVLLATTVVVIAAHPETARYLADRFLKENGVGYNRVEGSLLNGVTLYDINYNDAVMIKRLQIEYNILMLLNHTITRTNSHERYHFKNQPPGTASQRAA